jgi:hypothetical protein
VTVVSWQQKFQAEGHCRMCLRPHYVRPLTKHHLVPQRWFLREGARWAMWRNRAVNLVPLCEPCHRLVECDVDARRELRRCLAQAEVAFVISLRGLTWLDGMYPLSLRPVVV